jgi:hypothetical protein
MKMEKKTNKHCRMYHNFATYFLLVKFRQDEFEGFLVARFVYLGFHCVASQTHRMMIQDLSFISVF